MKKDTHPKYNSEAQVICACGHKFSTGAVIDEIKTELCSACHPFYTGKQKLVDTARRVEKFKAKVGVKDEVAKSRRGKKVKRAARKANEEENKEKN
jgi:large subunit ribosomal protein L31